MSAEVEAGEAPVVAVLGTAPRSDDPSAMLLAEAEAPAAAPAPGPAPREVIRTPTRQGADRGTPTMAELYRQDAYGRTFLTGLMRAQFGITLSVLIPASAILALYPLLAVLFPSLDGVRVLGLPLALIVLGGGIYPPLVVLGFWYVKRAERLEQRFVELLEDRD